MQEEEIPWTKGRLPEVIDAFARVYPEDPATPLVPTDVESMRKRILTVLYFGNGVLDTISV
eukprot:scaffold336_cov196-Amphora_coffeaeformis.AAC.17